MEWGSWMKWPEMEPHGNSAIDATPSITSSTFPVLDSTPPSSSATGFQTKIE
jgi:hypothetical protein